MWSQSWNNIFDIVEPFKGKQRVDVTPEMVKQVGKIQVLQLENPLDLHISSGIPTVTTVMPVSLIGAQYTAEYNIGSAQNYILRYEVIHLTLFYNFSRSIWFDYSFFIEQCCIQWCWRCDTIMVIL
jgi:hypothetical protein